MEAAQVVSEESLDTVKFYDNELVDDTSKYMSNVLPRVHKGPLHILPGVINKQTVEALAELNEDSNKAILFTLKYSKAGGFEDKPEHAEPL